MEKCMTKVKEETKSVISLISETICYLTCGPNSFDTTNICLLLNNLRSLEEEMQDVKDAIIWKTTTRFDILNEDKQLVLLKYIFTFLSRYMNI